MNEGGHIVAATDVSRVFAKAAITALDCVSLSIRTGEVVALVGPSGCGKSTLLNLLGGLDVPTRGTVCFDGVPLDRLGPLHRYRSRSVGFVFQFHHLLASMTLLENVTAPLCALGVSRATRRQRGLELLQAVGLEGRAGAMPADLSGGERQRVAVARALANRPNIILADEPTGNLDSHNGRQVVKLLIEHARQCPAMLLIATHNPAVASAADRIIALADGRLVSPGTTV